MTDTIALGEKIEELRKAIPKNIHAPVPDDVAPALSWYVVYNSAISDALSILDEHLGECVKEHRFESKRAFVEIWDDFEGPVWTSERFNPGDRIAIYKILANYPSIKEE